MRKRVRPPGIDAVVITCEHGGCRVPPSYRNRFTRRTGLLKSHRGWDPGALELARRFARALHAPLFFSTTTRLLVELNRSPGHPSLFSVATRDLPRDERRIIIERYYLPYRERVESAIAAEVHSGRTVLHLSVHTFTPVLNDVPRRADVGLLYDPKRTAERALAGHWRVELTRPPATGSMNHRRKRRESPAVAERLRIRCNYPYRGVADGFTTFLRRRFPALRYLGLELEVNQRFVFGRRMAWMALQKRLVDSLVSVLARARR